MSKWYRRVTANMSDIVEAISHFEKEIEEGSKVKVEGNVYKLERWTKTEGNA